MVISSHEPQLHTCHQESMDEIPSALASIIVARRSTESVRKEQFAIFTTRLPTGSFPAPVCSSSYPTPPFWPPFLRRNAAFLSLDIGVHAMQRCQLSGCYEEVFFDEGANRVHDFCCLSHAQEAEARGEWPPPGTQGSSGCQLPGCDQWVYRNPVTGEVGDRLLLR